MEKICVYGAGNWGSTAARIIAENTIRYDKFYNVVNMYVHKEIYNGRELTDIINTDKENTKYLPGFKFPDNVFATSDIQFALKDVTMLVVVIPHQFLVSAMKEVSQYADLSKLKVVSLIKGMYIGKEDIKTTTQTIESVLNLKPSVLSGANLANEIANREICESTLGCMDSAEAELWIKAFQTDYFRIMHVKNVYAIELCGALKNVVAVAVGMAAGLGYGNNTKAAIMRIGFMEILKFAQLLYPSTAESILFESCGIPDLITSCLGGRNYKVSVEFVKTGKSIDVLEAEMLNGQKLQGPLTSLEVNEYLSNINKTADFPLFTAVYEIVYQNKDAKPLLESLFKVSRQSIL
ncbi:Glycerol-3-phosphate dehydrogenase 1-like protein [Smittium culicis]|uniref:Glycerol-3-phosphate dehydrogenase [NAD(+)] n=1 Tax=Smittium culicis TaxID=133412 RepID=A0A1R1YJ42_9FUNG|nr:Glycerol-3-phosphate dehydrogenase 1-like protein [Smittium culicis]OMJ28231.1 Glycerol-3-phosphate dehydrogenase 1-like protein [Smittium culicis]